MYALALEDIGVDVEVRTNIGSREVYFRALQQGDIDLFPEYTGSLLNFLSDGDLTDTSTEALIAGLRAVLGDDIQVLEPSEAENRNGLVITRELSERLGITTTSQLAQYASDLVAGGAPETRERADGLPGYERVYGIRFADWIDLDPGGPLTVAALQNGDIDVARLFTSQGVIAAIDWVVLVDDGGKHSTDESFTHSELMYLCRERGIKYVNTGRNVGMGPALNEGLKHCRGQWIARIDSDDIARPEWLAEQMAFIASTKDVHVVSCQHQAFGTKEWISKHPKKQTAKTVSKYKPGRTWIINHGGTLLRTETLLGVGGYSKELRRRGQDFELWIEYLKQGFAIYTNPKVLYDYRVHDGQPEAAEWWAEYAVGLIEGLKV
jgi:glycosyltransferase involved in cell wall biosynthesis